MKKFLVTLLIMQSITLCARVAELGSEQALWNKVNRSQIVIAQLYAADKNNRRAMAGYKNNFKAVSENARYTYAELCFVAINVARCDCLPNDLGFACLPAIVIFVDGKPLEGHLCGERSSVEINQYIDTAISNLLDSRIQERKEFDAKEEDARLAAWAYWGPWWGCGSFYGPCYSYGFGWGFPGRCGNPFMGGWQCTGNNSAYCCPYR